MNPDRQIIVGGYLLTTNIKEETTSVALVDNSGLKSAEEETTLDWDINVFDYLETGNRASLKRSFCKNTDDKNEWKFGLERDFSRIQAKVCFQRAGWYNSIIIKFKLEKRIKSGLYYKLHYKTQDAWYRRRNRSTTHFSRENSCDATEQGDEISHRPYNGTRRLSAAEVPVLFDYEGRINEDDLEPYEKDQVLLIMKCT